MTSYTKKHHIVYYLRYHLVWISKYRYKVLIGDLPLRVKAIIAPIDKVINAYINNHDDAHQLNHERNMTLG